MQLGGSSNAGNFSTDDKNTEQQEYYFHHTLHLVNLLVLDLKKQGLKNSRIMSAPLKLVALHPLA